jgi:hypothetical protein
MEYGRFEKQTTVFGFSSGLVLNSQVTYENKEFHENIAKLFWTCFYQRKYLHVLAFKELI